MPKKNSTDRCVMCGRGSSVLDIEPKGICGTCWDKYAKHIPPVQRTKYFEMLVKKKNE